MSVFQSVILGALQGITELFPVSSLGHSVILPALFGWNIDQSDPFFVSFLVLTHLATALVLFFFFWSDWKRIIVALARSVLARRIGDDRYARLGWLLVAGTVPAGLIGLIFQKKLEMLFAAPAAAAFFLMGNAVVLYACELHARRRLAKAPLRDDSAQSDGRIAALSYKKALGVGVAQSLALLPGFSRTGAALGGGLIAGLMHEDAARFSFLLATPIIAAAAVLKLPHLASVGASALGVALAGALASGIAAYLSVRFLTRYFKTRTLAPFALYCALAGALAFFALH